jgi:hypothetical protein
MIRDPIVRLAVTTLALLLAYRLGNFIPVSGLELSALNLQGLGSFERFSINALGMVPWLSAVTLVEFVAILSPEQLSSKFTRNGHARPFSSEVIILALLFATLQGVGISTALMHVPGLVIEPGHGFTLTTAATLATGTVVTIALARLIERHGVGYGFWIMLAAWSIGSIAPHVTQLIAMLSQGATSLPIGIAAVASDVAIIAAVVALQQARCTAGFTRAEPVVWPLAFAPLIAGWLAGFVAFINSQDVAPSALQWLVPNTPVGLMIHALIVGLFVIRYASREGSRAFITPTLALMVGATLVSQITWTHFGIQPLLGGASAVIVAAVLYAVIRRAASHGLSFGAANEND